MEHSHVCIGHYISSEPIRVTEESCGVAEVHVTLSVVMGSNALCIILGYVCGGGRAGGQWQRIS